MDARLEIRIDSDLLARLPSGRKRSEFVRGALEAALDGSRSPVVAAESSGAAVVDPGPVSPRASEPPAEPDGYGRELNARPAPSVSTGEPPTAQQLVGWTQGGLTIAAARRVIDRGEWGRYKPD